MYTQASKAPHHRMRVNCHFTKYHLSPSIIWLVYSHRHKESYKNLLWYPYIIPLISHISFTVTMYGESTYQWNLNNDVLVQKKLIRMITCSPFITHTEPLLVVDRLMSLSNINMYMTCIFVYQCLNGCVPDIFIDFYTSARNIHGRDTHWVSDSHVPYEKLDVRKKQHENTWNKYVELNSRKY